MDRNSLIGLLLIGALLIGYSIWTKPSEEERLEQLRIRDSIQNVQMEQQAEARRLELLKDSLGESSAVPSPEQQEEQLKQELGGFSGSATGEEELLVMENQFLKLAFSTKGGKVYSAELKEYKTWDQKPLILFEGEENQFDLKFYAQNKPIFTENLYFVPQTDRKVFNDSTQVQSLTMRLEAGEGRWIDFVYSLEPESYRLGFEIKLHNMNEVLGRNTPFIDLDWGFPLRQQERGFKFASQYSSIYYKFFNDEVGHLRATKEGSEDLTTKVEWIGYKQQFFSTVLRTDNYFNSAKISTTNMEEESGYLKHCQSAISLPIDGQAEETIPLSFYFVPNHFKVLKDIGHELNSVVDLGWPFISWINKWFVVNIFHYLEGVFNFKWKYGLIIIILTIFFKTLLLPLSYRSFVSGAKMRVLKPQIDEINQKFSKDKAMEKQQATMALYKKAGVNPMGGCLPMLLQMPIWLALFRFFPASIELRQQSFLWATDLSSYDSIINLPFNIPAYGDHVSLFTLLMAVSMALTTKVNMAQTDTGQQMPGMKLMMYLMPVMMLFWFNSYASGLSFYYFVSNLITFLQMYLIKRTIDEEKILKKLTLNQKKPQKKSSFQTRLEKMARERQQLNNPRKR